MPKIHDLSIILLFKKRTIFKLLGLDLICYTVPIMK